MDQQKNLKAILFDFDGTIIDLKTNYDSLKFKLNLYFKGLGINQEFSPLVETINECLELLKDNKNISEIKKKVNEIIDEEELKAIDKATLKEESKRLLNFLKNRYKIAIISRNGRKIILNIFNKFDLPTPDLIVGRDDVEKLKPNNEHINKVLTKLEVNSDECIIVGDSIHDIETGRKANIKVILINEGLGELFLL